MWTTTKTNFFFKLTLQSLLLPVFQKILVSVIFNGTSIYNSDLFLKGREKKENQRKSSWSIDVQAIDEMSWLFMLRKIITNEWLWNK